MLPSRIAVVLVVTLLGAAPIQAQATAQQPNLVLYQGQWMRKYDVEQLKYVDYKRAHGYVRYFGKWRRSADVKKIRRDAGRQMNRLASSFRSSRDRARAKLHEMAHKHDIPRLAVLADRVHKDYSDYWRRYRIERRRYTVTMGVNFQHTELLGMDTVPVSLGTGRVNIQLPRTRSVSIGTTVTVPAGIGR